MIYYWTYAQQHRINLLSKWLSFINAFSLVFFSVLSLKCLSCLSDKSWDDCKGKSKSCVAPVTDDCIKMYLKSSSEELFVRGCSTNDNCDTNINALCRDAYECDIYCCNGDDCNASTATHISGVLLLSCALASLSIFSKPDLRSRTANEKCCN